VPEWFAPVMQWVGGGTIISIAIATLKVLRDSRDELRDLRREIGRLEPPTGLFSRVGKNEEEIQQIWELMIHHGLDQRKTRRQRHQDNN